MANKMADKKKNASKSQQLAAVPASAPKDKSEQLAAVPASTVRSASKERVATKTREAKKEQPKQENRPVQRDTRSSGWLARLRNNRIGRFLFDAYYELRHKVTWPTFNEARNMTVMVLVLSAVVAVILGVADLGLYQLFLLISGGK